MSDALPLGPELDWTAAKRPARAVLRGKYVLLRPLSAASDARSLYAVSHPPTGDPAHWTYLPDGPYESPERLRRMLAWAEGSDDPLYFTLAKLPDERPERRFGGPPPRPRPSTCWRGTPSTRSATAAWSGSATR